MSRAQRVVGFMVLIGLIVGLGWFIFIPEDKSPQPVASQPTHLTPSPNPSPGTGGAAQTSLIIGRSDAPVTITKYGDFKCPICKRFFETTEPQLLAKYVDTGRVKIHFVVDTHIGQESVFAGEGAYCAAEQGKFREYHDFIYSTQGEFPITLAMLKGLVGDQVELDDNSFDDCIDSRRYQERVVSDDAESGRVGGHTTPTFVIGERKISGAQPLSIFDTILRSGE